MSLPLPLPFSKQHKGFNASKHQICTETKLDFFDYLYWLPPPPPPPTCWPLWFNNPSCQQFVDLQFFAENLKLLFISQVSLMTLPKQYIEGVKELNFWFKPWANLCTQISISRRNTNLLLFISQPSLMTMT